MGRSSRVATLARRALLVSLLAGSLTPVLVAQNDPNAAPNGQEQSLGDVARKLREERAKSAPPKVTLDQSGVNRGVPAGFKQAALPSGALAVFLPSDAIADEGSDVAAHYHVLLDNPKRVVMISFGAAGEVPAGARLEDIPPDFQRRGIKVLESEQKTINGNRALVMRLEMITKDFIFHEFQADVIAGTQGYAVTCGSRAEDFASVESTCRTVIESAMVK